jgi:hypothetical protein
LRQSRNESRSTEVETHLNVLYGDIPVPGSDGLGEPDRDFG